MSSHTETARLLVRLIPLLMRNITADVRCYGAGLAPTQFRILGMLSEHPLSLTALADYQAVSLASMSNSVATLVERGLVIRIPSPDDRRVVHFKIAPAGVSVLTEAHQLLGRRTEHLLASLSETEIEALHHSLGILRKVLEAAEWKNPLIPCDGAHSNPGKKGDLE